MKSLHFVWFVVLVLCGANPLARGATLVWSNPDGGDWHVPGNWSPNQVPGPADTAVIAGPGTYVVTVHRAATAGNVRLGTTAGSDSQILRILAGTFSLNGAVHSNGTLRQEGGSIVVEGTNTVVDGIWDWLDGGITGPGAALTIGSSATLNISTESLHDVRQIALTNRGTVRWTGGAIRTGTGSRIENEGLWMTQVTNQINHAYGGATAFNNPGRFEVSSGRVTFLVGGRNTGTFDVATNGFCDFHANYQFADGTAFTGAGRSRLVAGTHSLEGTIFSENLELTDGDIRGTHRLLGSVDWLGSRWVGMDETTTLSEDATLNLVSARNHDLVQRTFVNSGTVRWKAGALRTGTGTRIVNQGRWVAEESGDLNTDYGGTSSFDNPGRFEVLKGTLRFRVNGTSSGTFDVATNAVCAFYSAYHFGDGTAFTGAGVNQVASGNPILTGTLFSENLELAGGSVGGTHALIGTVYWVGSHWGGVGESTTIGANGTLVILSENFHDLPKRTLINAGAVVWLDGVIRTGQGGRIENFGSWVSTGPSGINTAFGGEGRFNNHGYFEVASGEVALLVEGSGSGVFHAGTNTLCRFVGDYQFNDGTRFTGAGVHRIAAGTQTLTGRITSDNLELAGGELVGTHTFLGTVRWAGSRFTGEGGVTTVARDSTLLLVSEVVHDVIERTLINEGTVLWTTGQVRSGRGSRLVNQGLWRANVTNQINAAYGGSAAFDNPGRFVVENGVVTMAVPGSSTGTFATAVGAVCQFVSSYHFADGTRFLGDGVHRLAGSTFTLDGRITSENLELTTGDLNGNHTFVGVVDWVGSRFTGSGATTTIAPAATLNIVSANVHDAIQRTLINEGTVRWLGGAVRSGQGGRMENRGLWRANVTNQINDAYGGRAAFDNPGRFEVENGTVTFALPGTSSGVFAAAAGAVSQFNSGYHFANGTTFSGAGVHRLLASTMRLEGSITSENLELVGGDLVGTHTFFGAVQWIGSRFLGKGDITTIARDATLRIVPSGVHDLIERTLINDGTVLWMGGSVRGGLGSRFENLGRWVAQANVDINAAYGGNSVFVNAGSLEIDGRDVTFSMGFANPGGTLAVTDDGSLRFSRNVDLAAGLLTGNGTIQAPTLTSAAVVRPGAPDAVLRLVGDYRQLPGGALQIDVSGTNSSQVTVTGTAQIQGSISLTYQPGNPPIAGASLNVLTAGRLTGEFATQEHFYLPGQDLRLVSNYGPTTLALVAVAEADPIHAPLTIHRTGQPEHFQITCPSEFAHYPLYSRASLTEGSWTLVPNATGPVYEGPLGEAHRFFRRSLTGQAPAP